MITPLGFKEYSEDDTKVISYRSTGIEALVPFVSFVCFTLGSSFLYSFFISESGGVFGGEAHFIKEKSWFPIILFGCISTILIGVFYPIIKLLGSTEFVLHPDRVVIRRKLFLIYRTSSIGTRKIDKFMQFQDGGEGEDSFLSWGLRIDSQKPIKLLSREPHEVCLWLGKMLSERYEIPFEQ